MNFEFLKDSQTIENLGWTLVHSLWQITFPSALLFFGLKTAQKTSANFRYLLACSALFLTFALPVGTFVWFSSATPEISVASFTAKSKGRAVFPEESQPDERLLGAEKNSSAAMETAAQNSSLNAFQTHFANYFAANLPFLVWFWLAGVLFFAVRTTGGLWRLHNLKTRKLIEPNTEWQKRFADLRRRAQVAAKTRLLESAQVAAPIVVGWLKPVILVPSGAFLGLTPAQLEAIVVHELMHIRRADFLVNFLQTLVEILLFFHPCVWWISRQIRREREFVCDDLTVKFYGEPLVYARALANLEQFRSTKQNEPQLSLAANGGNLMKRIQRILQKETEIKRANSLWSAGLAFVFISALVLSVLSGKDSTTVNAGGLKAKKKIAVGFVSLPPGDRSDNPPRDGQATAQLLIEKLKKHNVPAIGFLLGGAVSDGEKLYPVRAETVRNWRDAGFEIGIGGFRHIWFYHTPFDEYVANVEKNEQVAKKFLSEKNQPLRYFSYPFLNTGKTTEDKVRFENWLAARGLRSVKYTFDNQEWMYSYAYDMARFDDDLNTMKQIRAEFLDYLTKMTDHYEAYSQEIFNRQISQTMVLTPSRLVADTADELFGMLKKRDYEFVSMDEAQSDDAYKTEENFVGASGISWFERWQMKRGAKLLDEPRVSKTVWETWEAKKPKK